MLQNICIGGHIVTLNFALILGVSIYPIIIMTSKNINRPCNVYSFFSLRILSYVPTIIIVVIILYLL